MSSLSYAALLTFTKCGVRMNIQCDYSIKMFYFFFEIYCIELCECIMRDVNVPLLVKMLFGLLFPTIRLLKEIDRMLQPTLSFYEP